MRILIIGRFVEEGVLSGPEKFCRLLSRDDRLLKKNIAFADFFLNRYSKYNITDKLFGKLKIKNNPDVFRLGIFPLLKFMAAFKPDIIHIAALDRYQKIIFAIQKLFGYKIITTFHGIIKKEIETEAVIAGQNKTEKDFLLENTALMKSHARVFVSNLQISEMRKYYPFSRDNNYIIHNGIKINNTLPKRTFISPLNIFTYTGSYPALKGLNCFLEIAGNFKDEFNFHLILSKKINPGQIQGNVKVHQTMDQPAFNKFMSSMDIYLNTSGFETFSYTALESMALGIIPVIPQSAGISEHLRNGENGFIYSGSDEAISTLKNIHSVNLEAVSDNAQNTALQLTSEAMVKNYIELYSSI